MATVVAALVLAALCGRTMYGQAFSAITAGTNTSAAMVVGAGGNLNIQGNSPFTAGISASGRMLFTADFSSSPSPANGSAGIEMQPTFPSSRGSSYYYGFRCDWSDTAINKSACFVDFNNGTADSMYLGVKGNSGTSSPDSPTGLGMDLNANPSAIANGIPCTSGSSCEDSSSTSAFGVQIYDWTHSSTSGIPLTVWNVSGGTNPLVSLANLGNGPATVIFQAGKTAEEQQGFNFKNASGVTQWLEGMNAQGISDHWQVRDVTNSVNTIDAVAGGAFSVNLAPLATSGGNSFVVGALAPLAPLTGVNTPVVLITGLKASQQTNGIVVQTINGGTAGPSVGGESASGTYASPSNSQNGDQLMSFYGAGYTGSAWTGGRAAMVAYATENFSSTNQGAEVDLQPTPNGTTGRVHGIYVTASTISGNTISMLQFGSTGVFSALPTCASGLGGSIATVTDSATNTWGATITGSGSDQVLAYCDGSAWTVFAK